MSFYNVLRNVRFSLCCLMVNLLMGTINVRDEYSARGPLIMGLKNAIDDCGQHGVECVGIGILTGHM